MMRFCENTGFSEFLNFALLKIIRFATCVGNVDFHPGSRVNFVGVFFIAYLSFYHKKAIKAL